MGLLSFFSDVYSKAQEVAITMASPLAAVYIQHAKSSEKPNDEVKQLKLTPEQEAWFIKLTEARPVERGCYIRIERMHGGALTGESFQRVPGLKKMIREHKPSQPGCFVVRPKVHSLPGQELTGEKATKALAPLHGEEFKLILPSQPTVLPGCYSTLHIVPKGLENFAKPQ